jgi:hypothetical protein
MDLPSSLGKKGEPTEQVSPPILPKGEEKSSLRNVVIC